MSGKTRSIVGGIVTLVGYVLTTTPFAAVGYGLIVVGAAISYDAAKRQAREAERRARAGRRADAVRGNVRGTHEHHLLVFGETRVGGIVVDAGATNGVDFPNQNQHVRIVHSLCHPGGCGGIGDFWVDDTRIANAAINGDPTTGLRTVTFPTHGVGLVEIRHWLGRGDQGNDAAFPGDGGAATAYLRGMASTHFKLIRPNDDEKFRKAFKYGFPTLSVQFKGIKCYDPRLDSTNGGAGTHRLNDYYSWAWSSNPALCAATYMIMLKSDGGMEVASSRIVWSSVAAAAGICDELIGTPAGNKTRYTGMGVVLSTADDRDVNLQKLLDTMMGKVVPVGNMYKIYAGAYRAPTGDAIDDTWLAGPLTITTRKPLEALYNAVRVNYDDAALDYKTIEAPPYISAAYEAQDGNARLWHDMTLPGVTDGHRAQYLSQMFNKKGRYGSVVEMVCNLKAMDLEVWENKTLNFPGVNLAGRVWRLAMWNRTAEGIKLAFEEDHSSIYTPEAFQAANTAGTTSAPTMEPPVPGAASAVPMPDGNLISFTPPPAYTYEVVEVYGATSSGGAFTLLGEVPNRGSSYLHRRTDGNTHYYKLRTRNRLFAFSAYTAEFSSAAATSGVNRTALTSGDVDMTRPGVINRNADNISEAASRKWAAETGANVTETRTSNDTSNVGARAAATVRDESRTGYNVTVAASGQRLGDQRNEPVITGLNRTAATITSNPLSSVDAGTTATINIAAFTLQGGFGTISYNSGSVAGLIFSTVYYIYADDPTYAGGAVTYFATTAPSTVTANSGRVFVDKITTVADGGGGGSPPDNCVVIDSWLDDGIQVGDVAQGKVLHCMSDDLRFFDYPIAHVEPPCPEVCARVLMEGGAAITLSLSTPVTLSDGRRLTIAQLLPGHKLATQYNGQLRWDAVRQVVDAGVRSVRRIHVDGHSYAAGECPEALIYTHNPLKP